MFGVMTDVPCMKPVEPLALNHSWPLFDRTRRFDLGSVQLEPVLRWPLDPNAAQSQALAEHGVGLWECDLSSGRLAWSGAVHDLFGVPRHVAPSRPHALSVYADESRAAMERLRDYAIKHRRGFTIDVELRPGGTTRWMRLIAAPVCADDGTPLSLHGIKFAL
jgi:PAS domain-containing protein